MSGSNRLSVDLTALDSCPIPAQTVDHHLDEDNSDVDEHADDEHADVDERADHDADVDEHADDEHADVDERADHDADGLVEGERMRRGSPTAGRSREKERPPISSL